MTSGHAYELPPRASAPAEAVDAADIRAARVSLADPAPSIPMAEILAEYADDLVTCPDEL